MVVYYWITPTPTPTPTPTEEARFLGIIYLMEVKWIKLNKFIMHKRVIAAILEQYV
jgi:hypothetical protein